MKKKTDKRTNGLMIALTIAAAALVLLLVIGGSLFRQNIWKRAAAYQVGEETYSVAEVEWYYYTAYYSIIGNASGYTEILGLDTDLNLSEQQCPLSEGLFARASASEDFRCFCKISGSTVKG